MFSRIKKWFVRKQAERKQAKLVKSLKTLFDTHDKIKVDSLEPVLLSAMLGMSPISRPLIFVPAKLMFQLQVDPMVNYFDPQTRLSEVRKGNAGMLLACAVVSDDHFDEKQRFIDDCYIVYADVYDLQDALALT